MQAIVIETFGTADVLRLHEVPDPMPAAGEVLVDVRYAGVNFMDVGTRTDRNGTGVLPLVPGVEGMGVVRQLGEGVAELAIGQRVAWYFHYGSYAERAVVPVDALVPVPDNVEDSCAAALMMQGLTAHHLATSSHAVKPGDVCVVHAAAGGVGALLTQIVKLRGGRVIAVVSNEGKARIAREVGADELIVGSGMPFQERVLDLTGGAGADVVFDGVGAATYEGSVASLRPHGQLVSYGQASGSVPPVDLESLPNSILVTYAVVMHHVPDHETLVKHAGELFEWVTRGHLKVLVGKIYPLADAVRAHRDIETRGTVGKLLLRPGAAQSQ